MINLKQYRRSSAGLTLLEVMISSIILLIVGREPSQVFRRPAQCEGSARLVFDRVTIDDTTSLDCRLRAGEVVGFVGLRGAGQERVGRALFGLARVTGGRILLDGQPVAAS